MPINTQCDRCATPFSVAPYRAATARACSTACENALRKAVTTPSGEKYCRRGDHYVFLSDFAKDSRAADKLQSSCNDCNKKYYEANKERIAKRNKGYRQKNAQEISANKKRRWATNRDTELEKKRAYWRRNKAELNRRQAERREVDKAKIALQQRKTYLKHRESRIEKVSHYIKAHPEVQQTISHNRRARKLSAAGSCAVAQWEAKRAFWGYGVWGFRCYLCRHTFKHKEMKMNLEHRKPLSRGGSEWPANLAPACQPCNSAKGQKTEKEYREFMRLCDSLVA